MFISDEGEGVNDRLEGLVGDAPAAKVEDMDLLRRYAATGCKDSFQQLVTRHMGWVFAMCRRRLRDTHLAEDAAQAVFLILSRRAGELPAATRLTGWLFRAARFAVNDARKRETRYRNRQEMASDVTRERLLGLQREAEDDRFAPVLDDAMAGLSDKDRQAILLHFYEGMTLAEMGDVLGLSREGAKKRVSRAVEKMRAHFGRKKKAISATALAALFVRQLDAAPYDLIARTGAAIAGGQVPSGMSLAIAEGVARSIRLASTQLMRLILAGQITAALLTVAGLVAHFASPSHRIAEDALTAGPPTRPTVAVVAIASKDAVAGTERGKHGSEIAKLDQRPLPIWGSDRMEPTEAFMAQQAEPGQELKPVQLLLTPADRYIAVPNVDPSLQTTEITSGDLNKIDPPAERSGYAYGGGSGGWAFIPLDPGPAAVWRQNRMEPLAFSAQSGDMPVSIADRDDHSSGPELHIGGILPEPGSLSVLMIGASLLAIRRRR